MIERLDRLVLTVADIEATCAFYAQVLGMRIERFGAGRVALHFGQQKINLHQVGKEFEPKAHQPTAGSGDLCFIASEPIDHVIAHLRACGVEILLGPAQRNGALGPMTSIYLRDPDGNLIEVSSYDQINTTSRIV